MLVFLSLSFTLYFSGLINCLFINNKNLLTFLISTEIMFLGIDLLFIGTSLTLNNYSGVIFAFLILMLTVGESVVGLGLCVLSLKLNNSISCINYSNLKH